MFKDFSATVEMTIPDAITSFKIPVIYIDFYVINSTNPYFKKAVSAKYIQVKATAIAGKKNIGYSRIRFLFKK
ncbi:hypothetical protein QF042_004253 [Pedobacter sp. W3I1]|nr:hypothetical protein [Pedobacter sp. W3I1]